MEKEIQRLIKILVGATLFQTAVVYKHTETIVRLTKRVVFYSSTVQRRLNIRIFNLWVQTLYTITQQWWAVRAPSNF